MERAIITSKEIGETIRNRRKELGISQERLAELLGVSYQQIQRYENGTNKLNVENLQMIDNILSMPVSQFFKSSHRNAVAEETMPYTPAEEKALLKISTTGAASSSSYQSHASQPESRLKIDRSLPYVTMPPDAARRKPPAAHATGGLDNGAVRTVKRPSARSCRNACPPPSSGGHPPPGRGGRPSR